GRLKLVAGRHAVQHREELQALEPADDVPRVRAEERVVAAAVQLEDRGHHDRPSALLFDGESTVDRDSRQDGALQDPVTGLLKQGTTSCSRATGRSAPAKGGRGERPFWPPA